MRSRPAWIAAVLLLSWQGVEAASLLREQGDAHSADGGRLLYREVHYFAPDGASGRWVLYRCPDGGVFARKHVLASAQAAAPNFALDDGRDGYREGVRGARGARSVYVGQGGHPEDTRALAVPADGVIDAGFDAAVRAHWAELMRGEALRMQFLVPSRQRFFPVRVQRSGTIDWRGVAAEKLRMRLDTWFGFALPDVVLVYARDDHRLLEFDGTGNVRDARGRNPQVQIVFAGRPASVPAEELAQALALPLDGHCRF